MILNLNTKIQNLSTIFTSRVKEFCGQNISVYNVKRLFMNLSEYYVISILFGLNYLLFDNSSCMSVKAEFS